MNHFIIDPDKVQSLSVFTEREQWDSWIHLNTIKTWDKIFIEELTNYQHPKYPMASDSPVFARPVSPGGQVTWLSVNTLRLTFSFF